MRRRLVDLGLTAVGAAALIGLVKALPLLAAFITFPKVWTAGEILTSSDLNAEFAAVSAQVNANLDDTNISSSAAIKGSKLADAPNGVTTAKLNDLAVTGGKLAVGASLMQFQGASAVTSLNVDQAAGETVWLQFPSLTTRGGIVGSFPAMQGQFQQGCGDLGSLLVKIYRDATLLRTLAYALTTPNGTGCTGGTNYPVPAPNSFDAAPAGNHVYKITVTVAGAGTFVSDATRAGAAFVVEFS